MNSDPYAALGLTKSATDAEIKKAYRKIVKTSHPDLNPDDPGAEARFKAASAAYDLLKDPEQRARFDRGEIDASGQERPEYHFYKQYAGAEGNPYQGGGFGGQGFDPRGFDNAEDLSSFFDEYLRGRAGGTGQGFGGGFGAGDFHAHGADRHFRLEVPFMDAVLGATKRITLPDGNTLEVTIPRGIRDGQTLRLRGKGEPGIGKGQPGDALITVHVAEHPTFKREGDDIRITLPIGLDEAVLGARVEVPTITGPVKMRIPKGASSGKVLRMKGKGVMGRGGKRGDQLVELRIVLPPRIDPDLEQCMEKWRAAHGGDFDPRRGMKS